MSTGSSHPPAHVGRSHISQNLAAEHRNRADDELLTTDEVAHRCRTSASTVRYWRHCGRGPDGFKIGRRVVYPRSALDAWLRHQHAAEHRG